MALTLNQDRVRNAKFAAYSWFTDALVSSTSLAVTYGPGTRVHLLAKALDIEECRTMSPNTHNIFSLFRAQLVGGVPANATEKKLNDSLFKVLMSYRVLDVYSYMNDAPIRSPTTSGPVLYNKKTPFHDLNDVSSILTRSQRDLSDHLRKLEREARRLENWAPVPAVDPLVNPLLFLYSKLAKKFAKKRLETCIINLTSAAFHVGCLLKGNIYLPTNQSEIEQILLDGQSNTSDSSTIKTINDVYGPCGYAVHNPLYMALAVSPLMLLLPREYSELTRKEALLNLWTQIGGLERPPAVVAAEKAIWRVIFNVSLGQDVIEELKLALGNVHDAMSTMVPQWIAVTGMPEPSKGVLEDSRALSLSTGPDTSVHTRDLAMDVEARASHLASTSSDRPCQPLRTDPTVDVATRHVDQCSGLVGESSMANDDLSEPGTPMSAAESSLRRNDNGCPGAAGEGGMANDNELVETPLAERATRNEDGSMANDNSNEPGTTTSAAESSIRRNDDDCAGAAGEGGMANDNELGVEPFLAGHATRNEDDRVGANGEGTGGVANDNKPGIDMPPSAAHQTEDDGLGGAGEGGMISDNESSGDEHAHQTAGGVANDNDPGIDMPPSAAHQTEDDDLGGAGEGGIINDNESSGAEHANQNEDDGNEDEIPPSPTEHSHHTEDDGLGGAAEGGVVNENESEIAKPPSHAEHAHQTEENDRNEEDIPPEPPHQIEDDGLGGAGQGGVINGNGFDIDMAPSGAEHAHQTEGDGGNEDVIPTSPTEQTEDEGSGAGGMVDIGHEASEGGMPDHNEIGSGTSRNVAETREAIIHGADYMIGEAGNELLSQSQPILDFDLSVAIRENIPPLSTELSESNRQFATIDPAVLSITCLSPLTPVTSPPPDIVQQQDSDRPITRNATRHVPSSDQVSNEMPLEMEASDDEDPGEPLDLETFSPLISGSESVTYPVPGSKYSYTFTPSFHFQSHLSWFYSMHAAALRPRDSPSLIHIMEHYDYVKTSPLTLSRLLAKFACIVVINEPCEQKTFSRDLLSDICSPFENTTLHDFTIDSEKRTRRGRPIDLCRSLASTSLKALSALHLPSASETFPFPPFSSDKVAWKEVQGRAYCRSWESYPVSDMRWGLAATGSTHHYWHIDSNGLGTFLRVEAGVKLWFIATPLKGNFDEFSSIDLFTPGFDLDKTNEALWNVEAVLLKAGSLLIMRSNLPHAVVTPEPTICKGGHYYATSTLKDSIVGIYHCFVAGRELTNTDHESATHAMLLRMLRYYLRELAEDHPEDYVVDHAHIPDALQWSGLMTLLYLANYFEMYSALVHWYYPIEDDVRGFKASVKNRMRARQLVLWFFENHTLSSPTTVLKGSEALEKIYVSFLAHQAKLLVLYKRKAWKAGLRGDPVNLTPKTFSRNIEECLKEGPAWVAYQSTTIESSQRSFSWHGVEYRIERTETPVRISFPFLDGFVYGDREMIRKLQLSIGPSVDLTRTGPATSLDGDLGEESEESEYNGDMVDEHPKEDGSTSRPSVDLIRIGAVTSLDGDLGEESEESEYNGRDHDTVDEHTEEDGSTSKDLRSSKRKKVEAADDAGRKIKKPRPF